MSGYLNLNKKQMDSTPIKHNPSSILSSLSLQSWWEKANDEVQFSYSKLSQMSTQKIEGEQYINGNYPSSQFNYNPKQDIPRSLTRNSSQSTKQQYSQGQEDLYFMIQDLNKRISQDSQLIQEMQRRIIEKDSIIVRLQELTKINIQQTYDRQEFESLIKQNEKQLENNVKKISVLEQENSQLKRYNLQLEQKEFELHNKYIQVCEQNEQLLQELELMNINQQKENQSYCALRRKNFSEYNIMSERRKYDQTQQDKFVDCIVDMVCNCQNGNNNDNKPSLKLCWKWLKNILEEYIKMKKLNNEIHLKSFDTYRRHQTDFKSD